MVASSQNHSYSRKKMITKLIIDKYKNHKKIRFVPLNFQFHFVYKVDILKHLAMKPFLVAKRDAKLII